MMTLLLVGLALQSLPNRWAENAKCEMLPVTTEPKTFEAFDLLSLNFAHFREDSSRATEALPRRFPRHAHTPIRSPSVVAACRAESFCSKNLQLREVESLVAATVPVKPLA
jgi:hypothetical protein